MLSYRLNHRIYPLSSSHRPAMISAGTTTTSASAHSAIAIAILTIIILRSSAIVTLVRDAPVLELLVGVKIPFLLVAVVGHLVVHAVKQRRGQQILPVLERFALQTTNTSNSGSLSDLSICSTMYFLTISIALLSIFFPPITFRPHGGKSSLYVGIHPYAS